MEGAANPLVAGNEAAAAVAAWPAPPRKVGAISSFPLAKSADPVDSDSAGMECGADDDPS